jgi:glycosyltransferase involved in cell wall biosynthesis
MKLLIVTQTVDVNDPILGFFHRWIKEFAKHCEQVHVFALNVGEYSLPENVHVHCLGKSEGKSKIIWLWRLWQKSWSLRDEYDSVFVHMNPEYVLFGGLFWWMLGKRIGLWYAHGTVTFRLRCATFISNTVFTSSAKGFRIASKKRSIVGQGIDTNIFAPKDASYMEDDILRLVTVGRITPVKHLAFLIDVVAKILQQQKVMLTIAGVPMNDTDRGHLQDLHHLCAEKGIDRQVVFAGSKTQEEIRDLLHEHHIFVHAGRTGSLDKAVLEAMSAGVHPLTSSEAFTDLFGAEKEFCTYPQGDAEVLVSKLVSIAERGIDRDRLKRLRNIVVNEHGIEALIRKIVNVYKK